MSKKNTIVTWGENFATGIPLIDKQHMELVNLTNLLYQACLAGEHKTAFKDAMSMMVDYVRFHFTAELELLKRINYPGYSEHKAEHDSLVKQILEAVQEFKAGRIFVPHSFVRTLKDWVFGHIGFTDRKYSKYVAEQKSLGLLSDKDLAG